MEVTPEMVKSLREATGAGMMDCKIALKETSGHFDEAVKWLREKGMASAAKREDRAANQGAVASYIHMGGKIGVLVEVNCETDFVARTDRFQEFCRNLCLHVCSAAPRWIQREDVPEDTVASEKAIYVKQASETGKPAHVCEKIAEGKLNKWFQDVCLLEQPFVRDTDKTIEQLMKELSGALGEKVAVRRFARFQLGEAI